MKLGKLLVYVVGILGILGLIYFAIVAQVARAASVPLTWTAPGDPKPDGSLQRVTCYRINYSADSVKVENTPDLCDSLPCNFAPAAPGEVESYIATGLPGDMVLFFNVRAYDAAGNVAASSNIRRKTTPDGTAPLRIFDLF